MIVGFFCQFVFILSLIQRGARKWLHVSEVPEAHLTSFSHSKPGFFSFWQPSVVPTELPHDSK